MNLNKSDLVPISQNSFKHLDLNLGFANNTRVRKWLAWPTILGVYVILALIAVYPAPSFWNTQMIGGAWDSGQDVWNFWWIGRSVQRGNLLPYHTDMLYYPQGVSLAYHTLGLLSGYASLLIRAIFRISLPASYNTIVVLALITGALSACLLAKSLTNNSVSGFIAGITFAFSPYSLSRMHFGHIGVFVGIQFIPLVALFLLRGSQTFKWCYTIAAAVLIALIGWQSLDTALGTALFACVLIVTVGYWKHEKTKVIKQLAVTILVTGLLTLPVTLPLIRDYADFTDQMDTTRASIGNTPDLLNFFLPDRSTGTFWRIVLGKISNQPLTDFYQIHGQKTTFIGLGVLTLTGLAFLFGSTKTIWRWWLVAGLFFLLSLGPELYVNGQVILPTMPYAWLSSIPIIGLGREPPRWEVFLSLALAIVIGHLCATLARRAHWLQVFFMIGGLLIYGESVAIPVKLDDRLTTISPFYQQLAKLPSTGGILEIPVDLYGSQGPACDYMVYQTVHQKPITGGYIARTPSKLIKMFRNYPFLDQLRARIYGDNEPFSFPEQLINHGASELRNINIEYAILHKASVSASDADIIRDALTRALGEPSYDDNQIVVWQLPK